jgi:hypothetical protein
VDYKSETPFDSIESAQEYLSLLAQEVEEAKQNVEADLADAMNSAETRRLDALRLVIFKLDKLAHQVKNSRRILNDLRTLRRVMNGERAETVGAKETP